MMRIDRWLDGPARAMGSGLRRLDAAFERRQIGPARSIAFIKLAEEGSTGLAQTALLDAVRRVGRENVYKVVFDDNRPGHWHDRNVISSFLFHNEVQAP